MNKFIEEFFETLSAVFVLIQGAVAILLSRPLVFAGTILLLVIGGKGLKFNLGKDIQFQRGK